MSSTEAILAALGKIVAPGTDDEDLVSLGYVKDLKREGDKVSFSVEFPGPLTPARKAVADQCREALKGQSEGDDLSVELISRIPASFAGDGKKGGPAPGVKNFVAVASGKGGVGKSTIAVNLAVGLAKAGARVGLLDTDVYGPSVPLLLGVSQQAYMEEMQRRHKENPPPAGPVMLEPFEAYGVKTMSLGFLIEPDKAAIWRGPMVHGAINQLLHEVDWGVLDYLILDLPPGTGDVQLTLAQGAPLAGAVVVTTPQPVALADVRKALDLFHKTETEILGIVENMAYHACTQCGHRDDVFGNGGGERSAKEWGLPFLGSLPLDTQFRVSGDLGQPILARDEGGPLVDALWHVIDRVTTVLAGKVRARPRSLPIRRS